MIDISDGLASEILHLSEASNLGVKIFEEKLPILEETKLVAKEFGLNFSNCALNGGEEYELLFSITPNEYELIKKNNIDIKPIGYFTKDMLNKSYLRWLYTALTRATKKLYLINFKDEFFEI